MKPQNPPLSPSELRQQFDDARGKASAGLEESGAAGILRALSSSVSLLQNEGFDISITLRPSSCANAYHLLNAISGMNNAGPSLVRAYGFINFGTSSRFFAIATKHNGVDMERLYISNWNAAQETEIGTPTLEGKYTQYNIPGQFFDFGQNENALNDLQRHLVAVCANDAATMEKDEAQVFNREPPPAIRKPRPKLSV